MGERRPAFYAAGVGGWRDWWSLLHPPYTVWHLSYVAIGAALAPRFDVERLVAALAAFLLALGVGAHALDELDGRPLRTRIPDRGLVAAASVSLAGAVAIGVGMLVRVDAGPGFAAGMAVLIVAGIALVLGYNLELFGGRIHTEVGFAGAWGTFPLVTSYYAQAEALDPVVVFAGAAAFAVSWAQRALSTPARFVRRETEGLRVTARLADGSARDLGERFVLAPVETALRALAWGQALLALALVLARLTG